MLQHLTPVVLPFYHSHTCLDYILQHCSLPTTLVICSTREAFLDSLLQCNHCDAPSPESTVSSSSLTQLPQGEFRCPYLLEPTIGLLSVSRSIRLIFCPTLQHVRAFLSTYKTTMPAASQPLSASTSSPKPPSPRDDDKFPILGLFNSITLHRPTLEFSAQGISRTMAVAVEAAARAKVKLVIAEVGDENHQTRPDVDGPPHTLIWEEQVPFLSTTLRTMGAGDEGFMGRTVALRRVVGQWCIFEDDNKDDN